MESIGVYAKRFTSGTAEMFKRLKYSFYILFHPFDGYYDLKNDPKRKTVSGAVFLYFMLAFSHVFKRLLMAYLFSNRYDQLHLDILMEVAVAIGPFLLWTIANWCFTSLMDGDGKLVDIFCATAFATLPATLSNFITVPISHFVTETNKAVLTTVASFGQIWTYGMVFLALLVTHQYSVKKGIITTILSIVGMAGIAFVIVLVFFLCQQVVGFVIQLGTEIIFRINE